MGSTEDRASVARLAGLQFGSDRDIDANCGYKVNPEINDFIAQYDRKGLASTIVDSPPETTWKKTPIITDGSDGKSEFIKQWAELAKRLRVFHFLERADRLSGIGRYGIILIGAKDEGELKDPLESVRGPQDILFLQPYGEKYASVKEFETNNKDARFGQPLTYEVDTLGDLSSIGTSSSAAKTLVHYSRVIHIAEGLLDNEVYGEPRLKKVFDYLYDMNKIVGSGAEALWQTAMKGYALSPKDGYESDPDAEEATKEAWQGWLHNLQRLIMMEGLDVKELGAEPSDPSSVFKMIIQLISGKTRIPQRRLLGSERGELASSQDTESYYGMIESRQEQFAEPMILRALIQRLIDIKALKAPNDGTYDVEWPSLYSLSDADLAEIYKHRAEAMSSATAGAPQELYTEAERRVATGFTPEPDTSKFVVQSLDESDPHVQTQFEEFKRATNL